MNKRIKILLLFITLSLGYGCNSNPDKTDIMVTGEMKNLDGIKVYLEQNGEKIDSAVVKDGKFAVNGKVWNNAVADIWFYIKDENDQTIPMWSTTRIFLEGGSSYKFFANGRQQIIDHTHTLQTNSPNAQTYYDMSKKARRLTREYEALVKEFVALRQSKESFADTVLYNRYDDSVTYYSKIGESAGREAEKALIASNPNSYLSLSVLSHFGDLQEDLDYFVKIEKQLTGKFRETYHAKEFIKALAKVRTDLPLKLDVDAVNVAEQAFRFDDYKSKKAIVVDFWATWCAPCVEMMPKALSVEKQLKAKNIAYIFLSYDERVKTWKKASADFGLQHSYRIVRSAKPYLKEKLHIASIPRYVLMDNEGNVLVRDLPSPSDVRFMVVIDSVVNKL